MSFSDSNNSMSCRIKENKMVNDTKDTLPDTRGLGVTLFEKMKTIESNIAQIDPVTGHTETHGELKMRAIKVAQHLEARGIKSDDVISVCSNNNMDCYVPLLASFFLGTKMAPFDPILSLRDTIYLLKLTEPKIVFCEENSVELMYTALQECEMDIDIVVFGNTTKHIPFSDFLVSTGKEQEFEPKPVKNIHDTAIIYFTSGTTGFPKGVCLTHFSFLFRTMHYANKFVSISYARLYGITGTLVFLNTIFGGGARVMITDFDPTEIFKVVQDYKVNIIFLPAYFSYQLAQNVENHSYNISSLKFLIIIAGKLTQNTILKLRSALPRTLTWIVYGMTEVTGAITSFDPTATDELTEARAQSCGRIFTFISYKVVDLKTNESVGPNCRGELCIKSPSLMKEYYKNPETTAAAFDSEGYFRTGDIVYYDEEGYFYVVDRIKDILIYRLLQIMPTELEQIILLHPDVTDTVVISQRNEADGDWPMAIVVLKKGSTYTGEDIAKFVDEQVPDYKRLRGGVKIIDKMPFTATDKYKKRELRAMFVGNKF